MTPDGKNSEFSLDPQDWEKARADGHRVIDAAIARLQGLRDKPLWQPMPQQVRDYFRTPVPRGPSDLADILGEMQANLFPYAMGNVHPRFFGWYMGGSNYTGALAEFLGAMDGSNLGGGDTAAVATERQVISWLKELLGFPAEASGILASGGSIANFICLTVARNVMAGVDVRAEGVAALPQGLRFYASDQAHSCGQKAMEMLGLGAKALRIIPSHADLKMNVDALAQAIAEDRAAGLKPACVIATAGTTNAGSIDDIAAIHAVCKRENLWFHVDGCIGALLKLSHRHAGLVAGIELADSLALDPHKWMQAPFNAACALVRDREQHRSAFSLHAAYLEEKPRGIGSGEFLADYSPELSRSFMALKIWMVFKEFGSDRLGQMIDQSMAQARHLAQMIEHEPALELMLDPSINIVCFRHRAPSGGEAAIKALNMEIMLRLQEQGIAAPTDTTIHGKYCLRAAIVNHRTQRADLDLLVTKVKEIGAHLIAT